MRPRTVRQGLLLIPLLLAACTVMRPSRVAPPPTAPPFIITCWCGPPLGEFTDARAAELAAAGFTTVGAPCEGIIEPAANRRALEIAARHGIRLWISDPRTGDFALSAPDWESRLDAAVAEYTASPALGGYFVMDEPGTKEFEKIAPVVQRLQAVDPAHTAYVNLLPQYAITPADAYEEYVEQFISKVRPQLLSYDYYPFGEKKDRTTFFDNLATMRSIALRHQLPFMLIVQAMPHGHYRDPTEAELAWQVFHALAYGARGISYFAYWTPVHVPDADKLKFRYGLIENGKPTRHYFEAMRVNRKAAAFADQLASFDSIGVADSGGSSGVSFPIGPIEALEGGDITAGLFADRAGCFAALLVNRDYQYGVTVEVHQRAHGPTPALFDVATLRWEPRAQLSFTLAPGDAQLVRWSADAS
jgi:hypothetical protein